MPQRTLAEFIDVWKRSGGAELANSQSFLGELCDHLGVPRPDPTVPDESRNDYVFEKTVAFRELGDDSHGRIDLYRRDCFVLESKQGVEKQQDEEAARLPAKAGKLRRRVGTARRGMPPWYQAMKRAAEQARRYAAAVEHAWPPFLIVIDVGYCFDLYADFSRTGKSYQPFPDTRSFRIRLDDLADEEVRERLRAIWLDPLSLDPSKRSAAVTREIAKSLADLARRLEKSYGADRVAHFLMRCLFTMFAEDIRIGNFPEDGFTRFLESRRGKLETFVPALENLWRAMDVGAYADAVEVRLMRFNGGLFADCEALPIDEGDLELLIQAAKSRWEDVEPAIFGTLLERALDPRERHKLGAHYTPRAYVERLVLPTVIEPLREDWNATYAAAVDLHDEGKTGDAIKLVRDWHESLCDVHVLDPACGTGNFLYVALELIKRLEGEVLEALKEFGDPQLPAHTVKPEQFRGIEINPRAAAIASLVLEIGYLKWQLRTVGREHVNEPILEQGDEIECRDALLDYDGTEDVLDEAGAPVTRWDGHTTKPHPVTGQEVPDETARVREVRYLNPRKAEWPAADYIVGNPPFIGARRIRLALGDGYVNAVRSTYADVVETCDYVAYWWHHAAQIVARNSARRFGFITTNSIVQSYTRPVLERHLNEIARIRLVFAIPDHPWVDSDDGAAVRVAMTTCGSADVADVPLLGVLVGSTATSEMVWTTPARIGPFLTKDIQIEDACALRSNGSICFQGVVPAGDGFKLDADDLPRFNARAGDLPPRIRPYIIGKDLVQSSRGQFIIDCFGMTEDEVRAREPDIYQHLYNHVLPARRQNKRDSYRLKWWIFAEPRPAMRSALNGLGRYIATPYTAKFRPFIFVDSAVLPDAMVYAVASDDAFDLGILSSRIHHCWALSSGAKLGVGNDPRYTSKRCFLPFPFPDPDGATKERIRELGEQLDAHRKRRQELHPTLTMTGMYNVLEKLRAGQPLTDKDRRIHDDGLVSVLKQIHDDLDAAVAAAYGWPADLDDESILQRLVDLNRERAEEERRGIVRWLRPEFQNPDGAGKSQREFASDDEEASPVKPAAPVKKLAWPTDKERRPQERVRLLRQVLAESPRPLASDEIAARFSRANKTKVFELLETLVAVGQARLTPDDRYAL